MTPSTRDDNRVDSESRCHRHTNLNSAQRDSPTQAVTYYLRMLQLNSGGVSTAGGPRHFMSGRLRGLEPEICSQRAHRVGLVSRHDRNRDDGRQLAALRVSGSSIMRAGSPNVGRSPWKRCEVGIVGRYARSPDGLLGALVPCARLPSLLTILDRLGFVHAGEPEVRLGEAMLASPSAALSPRGGARQWRSAVAGRGIPKQACTWGAIRRTRTLRLGLGVGRRCVTLSIFRPGSPWALHAKLGSQQ